MLLDAIPPSFRTLFPSKQNLFGGEDDHEYLYHPIPIPSDAYIDHRSLLAGKCEFHVLWDWFTKTPQGLLFCILCLLYNLS